MILIITNTIDYTSYNVVTWLHYFSDVECIVLNELNNITEIFVSVCSNRKKVLLKSRYEEIIDFDKVSSIWYRRGPIKISDSNTFNIQSLNRILMDENNCLNDYLLVHDKKYKRLIINKMC